MNGLYIDDRVGSKELAKLFLPYGIQPKLQRMAFGDFRWQGSGPDHVQVGVAAERKTVSDLLDSVETKRLSGHQIPGMTEHYDYAYLVVEGPWRPSPSGMVEVGEWLKGGSMRWVERGHRFDALVNHLMGLSLRSGLTVWHTINQLETVAFLVAQYRMWTKKDWDEHTSHDEVYLPGVSEPCGRRLTAFRRVPSQAELHASLLPGIARSARYVAQAFPTVERMVEATPQEWAAVPILVKDKKAKRMKNRKLGPTNGRKAWEALRA